MSESSEQKAAKAVDPTDETAAMEVSDEGELLSPEASHRTGPAPISHETADGEGVIARLPRLGSMIDERYEVLAILGEGGFGKVYKARQVNTGQLVAVKVLLPDRLDSGDAELNIARERFVREMQVVGNLRHRHIVKLVDSGELDGGMLYMVLEFIEGKELSQIVREHTLRNENMPTKEIKRLMMQVLNALAAAHDQGYVHRDLKPQNIMITENSLETDAVVLDFGIAGITEAAANDNPMQLTKTRQAVGTVSYMAPEQLLGKKEPQTDIYAWGLIVLECLTGHTVVIGDTPYATALAHASPAPIPIPEPIRSHPLGPILAKAVAKKLPDRWQTVKELYQELQDCDTDDLVVPYDPNRFVTAAKLISTDDVDEPTAETKRLRDTPVQSTGDVPTPKSNGPLYLVIGVAAIAIVIVAIWLGGGFADKTVETKDDGPSDPPVVELGESRAAGALLASNITAELGGRLVALFPTGVFDLAEVPPDPDNPEVDPDANPDKTDALDEQAQKRFDLLNDDGMRLLREERDFDGAADRFTRALDIKDDSNVRGSLALALEMSGKPCDALAHYRQALELSGGTHNLAIRKVAELQETCE